MTAELEKSLANGIAVDANLDIADDGTFSCTFGGARYLVEIKVFDVSGA